MEEAVLKTPFTGFASLAVPLAAATVAGLMFVR